MESKPSLPSQPLPSQVAQAATQQALQNLGYDMTLEDQVEAILLCVCPEVEVQDSSSLKADFLRQHLLALSERSNWQQLILKPKRLIRLLERRWQEHQAGQQEILDQSTADSRYNEASKRLAQASQTHETARQTLSSQHSLNDRMAHLLEQTGGDKLQALDLALADQNLPEDYRQQLTMIREKLVLILGSGTNEVENQILADLIQECPIDFSTPEPNGAFRFFVTSLDQAKGVSTETKITIKAHLGIATDLQTGSAVLDRLAEPGQGDSPKYNKDNPLTIRAGVKAFTVSGKERHYIIQTPGLPDLEISDTTMGLTDQLRFALLWQRLQKHDIDRFLSRPTEDPGLVARDFCLKLYHKLLPITDSTLPEETDLTQFDRLFETLTKGEPKRAEEHLKALGLLDEQGLLNQSLFLALANRTRMHPKGFDLTYEDHQTWLKKRFDKPLKARITP